MDKTKSLALAIGLNFLLPGAGYLYYGKWIVGILGCALFLAMFHFSTGLGFIAPWFVMNIIMFLDMFILHGKFKKNAEKASMMRCGSCAESIRKEAKKCKHCGELQPTVWNLKAGQRGWPTATCTHNSEPFTYENRYTAFTMGIFLPVHPGFLEPTIRKPFG